MVVEAELQGETEETDDRMLAVEIEPEYRAANANITLTGEAACDRETTVTLYLREKGTKDWKFCNRVWLNQPCRCTIRMWYYNNESLKEETTYEYAVGIEENNRTGVDNLIQPVIGEFTTTKNELTLCDTEVSVGYDSFAVKTGYTGNTYKECKRLLLYYREKGAQTWQRSVFYSWNEEYQVTIRVGNDEDALKQGTEYEYELILASDDMIPDSPGEVAREDWKKTGSFTTKQRSYELEITPDEKNSTFDTEALKVSVS